MRKKYCTLRNKTVYAKICLDCGKLREVENVKTKETRWYCENLYEKVVFKGPNTETKRLGRELSNLAVGEMERYLYDHWDIETYSKK